MPHIESMLDALALLLFLAICFGTATTGAVFRPGAWYERLSKPAWTPPNWAFPLVWTILFTAMAVAAWLVWRTAGWQAWPVLAAFVTHLGVNALWSYLFFGRRRLDLAMVDVLLLFGFIAALIVGFWQYSTTAALLLLPYLAWVGVASLLNFSLLQRNGARGSV